MRSIDLFLVPGMQGLNVAEALKSLHCLCRKMNENEVVCTRVLDRLLALRDALFDVVDSRTAAQFADIIGRFIRFLKKYSTKKLLQRIASTRVVLDGVRAAHSEIDALCEVVGHSEPSEVAVWGGFWDEDLHNQRVGFELHLTTSLHRATELACHSLEEAMMKLRYEIDVKAKENSREHIELMERTLRRLAESGHRAVSPSVPRWYVHRDAVEFTAQPFGLGAFGAVHKGKWGEAKTEVVVKCLHRDITHVPTSFVKKAGIWKELEHRNVLKMYGACHTSTPVFFVCDFASEGNFAEFFGLREANKRIFWRLFLEAARGLFYLHAQSVVHGGVKCSNLLVDAEKTAKICDFMDDHTRVVPGRTTFNVQNMTNVRWQAPECLLDHEDPTPASDVYSLGMSIIEAKIGELPWGAHTSKNEIAGRVASGAEYPRPPEIGADAEWNLVQAMCRFDASDRVSLGAAIKVLEQFAAAETERNQLTDHILCGSCATSNPSANKFCGECGTLLHSIPTGS